MYKKADELILEVMKDLEVTLSKNMDSSEIEEPDNEHKELIEKSSG